jgi:putative copper resistance protein D
LGRPVLLLLHAARNPLHRRVLAVIRSRAAAVVTHPLVAAVAYAVTIAVTHLTGFMQVVLENDAVHELEHALYLTVGYLFFLAVVGGEPIRWRLSYPVRIALVFVTMPVDTVVGLVLYSTGAPVFPGYVDADRAWGPTPVRDVQAAGAVMWIGGDLIMLVVLLVLTGTFLFGAEGNQRGLGVLDAARAESLRRRTGHSSPGGLDDNEEALTAYNEYLARLGREHDRRG